jgi:hypothetical protein
MLRSDADGGAMSTADCLRPPSKVVWVEYGDVAVGNVCTLAVACA